MFFINKDEIRSIIREELNSASQSPAAEVIRSIIREEISSVKQGEHVPFAVYMGEGMVLTRTYFNVLYLVSSFDVTLAPHLIAHGVYESELTKYLLNNIKSDSVFVDVGANFGYYSCMVAKRVESGKGGKVFSFEANRNAFAILEKNISLNWIDWSAVSLNCHAISEKDGVVQFKNYKYRFGGSQIVDYEENSEDLNAAEVVSVETKRLDQALGQQKVDFIKIDVEGAEFKVLKGAENTIRNNSNIKLLIEWNNDQFTQHGASPAEVIAFLKDKKLNPFRLDWRDGSASPVTYDYLGSTGDHICAILFTR